MNNFPFNDNQTKNNKNIINNDINNTIIIDDNFMYTNSFDNSYIVINYKNLEARSPFKIIRLEKCFENLQKNKNIFLVSIPASGSLKEGMAKIIGISDDYMEIEIIKNIIDFKGLVNAIEIKLNNNYYLLSCTKGFKLWYYDSDIKEIKFKEIIPKNKNDDENNIEYQKIMTYKELIFIEKSNLLIVQVNFPYQYIFFYNINDDENIFSIIFLTKIKINKEDPYFSESPFNSFFIKDKYLLIGTKVDKNEKKIKISKKDKINNKSEIIDNKNKSQLQKENNNLIKEAKIIKAGFYIINLDIILEDISKIEKAINIKYIDCCKEVYCISHIRDNMFVSTFELINKNYTLTTFEIIEKNERIDINKISYYYGRGKNINSNKLINDSFIICSNNRNNSILRINKKGEIYYYCNLVLNNKF